MLRAYKLFIARDEKNHPLSIILAQNRGQADVFWQGMGFFPASVDEWDDSHVDPHHPTGVIPLLKFEIRDVAEFGQNATPKCIYVKS